MVIAGLVWLGFSLEEKYRSERARHPEAAVEREAAEKDSSSRREPIEWPSQLPSPLYVGWGLAAVGTVWTLIRAFEAGVAWFFVVFFGNIMGGLVFLAAHPGRAATPMAVWTAGYMMMLVSAYVPR
jgi:hypothetical protein